MPAEDGIAAVVLAAGASRRFGDDNKLLSSIDGRTLIVRVVDALSGAGIAKQVVVTGWEPEAIKRTFAGRSIDFAHNADWASGMGGSIGVGIAAIGATSDAALIVPADMPWLTAEVVRTLIEAFDDAGRDRVIYPATKSGEQRNPVLWPRRYFAALQALASSEGAKSLLNRLPASERLAVEACDEAAFIDVDTEAELEVARTRRG